MYYFFVCTTLLRCLVGMLAWPPARLMTTLFPVEAAGAVFPPGPSAEGEGVLLVVLCPQAATILARPSLGRNRSLSRGGPSRLSPSTASAPKRALQSQENLPATSRRITRTWQLALLRPERCPKRKLVVDILIQLLKK